MTFVTGDTETVFNGLIEQAGVISESSNIFETGWNTIWLGGEFFVLFFTNLLWFDYAFLSGDWIFLRFLFMSISFGILFSIFLAMRGTSSS